MGDLVLAVDCSTTASKVDRLGPRGQGGRRGPRRRSRRSTPARNEPSRRPRAGGTRPRRRSRSSSRRSAPTGSRAICITHQRESYAPVDEDNRVAAQRDPVGRRRAPSAQLDELGERFGHDELHRRTGRGPSLTQAFPKLLWLRAERARDRRARLPVHGRPRLPRPAADRASGRRASPRPTRSGSPTSSTTPGPRTSSPGSACVPSSSARRSRRGRSSARCTAGPPRATRGARGACRSSPGSATARPRASAPASRRWTAPRSTSARPSPAARSAREYVSDPSCRTMYAGAPGTFLLEECLRGGMATMTWFMRDFGDTFEAKADFDAYEAAAREVGAGGDGLVLVPVLERRDEPVLERRATGMIVGWHRGHGREPAVPRGRGGHRLRVPPGDGRRPGGDRRARSRST